MLKLSLVELLLRTIPEAFLLILGSYILYNKKIDKNEYIISSLTFSVCIYLVRMLPIHFGVHTLISMMAYIIISFKISKIPLNKSISYCLILTIIVYMCELVNIFVIEEFVSSSIETVLSSNIKKVLMFMPSLILFGISVFLLYIFMNKIRTKIRNERKSSI